MTIFGAGFITGSPPSTPIVVASDSAAELDEDPGKPVTTGGFFDDEATTDPVDEEGMADEDEGWVGMEGRPVWRKMKNIFNQIFHSNNRRNHGEFTSDQITSGAPPPPPLNHEPAPPICSPLIPTAAISRMILAGNDIPSKGIPAPTPGSDDLDSSWLEFPPFCPCGRVI